MPMLWLEMSRDDNHGGGDWGFAKALWSPTRKSDGTKWSFWESVRQTEPGDTVLHLRGIRKKAAFVGVSTIDIGGHETTERPPDWGEWEADAFYRALLKDYSGFHDPPHLLDIFHNQDEQLRDYFTQNKTRRGSAKKRLFYVIQSGRLQCLNGAYLSEVPEELEAILTGSALQHGAPPGDKPVQLRVFTDEDRRLLKVRKGQDEFSQAVRQNFSNRCCFPGCLVTDVRFLVGSHIARWADAPELRGNVSNGLCLCLIHDKAFEVGLFTLSLDGRVWVNTSKVAGATWASEILMSAQGKPILAGDIGPSDESLFLHWQRIKCCPEF